jgi:hypothetical protein
MDPNHYSSFGGHMAKEKEATIEEILATYSQHVSKNYPAPEEFKERMEMLLDNKRERTGDEEYISSLETNVVFLHDLVTEGEVLLGKFLRPDTRAKEKLDAILEKLEEKVRSQTKKRRKALFEEGSDEEFSKLARMKREKSDEYKGKLEFNYIYLMTLRIFLFEFFNVLESIKESYKLMEMEEGAPKMVMDSLGLTANCYLENVMVDEGAGKGE